MNSGLYDVGARRPASGGARELVRLAGDERVERERRVQAARLVRARFGRDDRRLRRRLRGDASGGCGWPAAAARTGMPTARSRGRRSRRRAPARRCAGVGDGEIDGHGRARRLSRERLDATAEALLDPLQHEPVGGGQGQSARPRPRRRAGGSTSRIAGRELALESGKAGRPARGDAARNARVKRPDLPVTTDGCGVTRSGAIGRGGIVAARFRVIHSADGARAQLATARSGAEGPLALTARDASAPSIAIDSNDRNAL